MTTAELIAMLSALPGDTKVFMKPESEETYGNVGLLPARVGIVESDGPDHPAFVVVESIDTTH